MEFTIDYLNTIIENLSSEPSVHVATTNKNSSSTTVKTEPFVSNEEQTLITANNNSSSATVKIEPFVLNEEQTFITATNHGSSTTVKNEPSIANEEETLTAANHPTDRQYCLIIFNNARWSERLRKKSPKVKQEPMNHETNRTEETVIKNEPEDVPSVDDRFIAQLRQLINDYMRHTKRPFPIKYFLDFTTN